MRKYNLSFFASFAASASFVTFAATPAQPEAANGSDRIDGRTNDPDGRKKYRDSWAAWWKDNESKIDIAKLGAPRQYLGYTVLSYYELAKGARAGKVCELDATGKVRRLEHFVNAIELG